MHLWLDAFFPQLLVSAQEWDSMSQEFAAVVRSSEGLQVAGWAFLKAFNPSMMQSSTQMFGSYGVSSLALNRARTLRRAANRAGPSVAAHPTSVAHQKVKHGGRCRLLNVQYVPGKRQSCIQSFPPPGSVSMCLTTMSVTVWFKTMVHLVFQSLNTQCW